MKQLVIVLLALSLTGCDTEYKEYLRLRQQGVTWNLRGFKIVADGRDYLCLNYEVVDAKAQGGAALIGGGAGVSVSTASAFRIKLFNEEERWERSLITELTCTNFVAQKTTVRSKNKYAYEP